LVKVLGTKMPFSELFAALFELELNAKGEATAREEFCEKSASWLMAKSR
jgi:hypothetical protein